MHDNYCTVIDFKVMEEFFTCTIDKQNGVDK